MCYDVVVDGRKTIVTDPVMLFDTVRKFAGYDEARQAEIWALNIEEESRQGTIKDSYIFFKCLDGKEIELHFEKI